MKDANAILSTAKETILLESNAIANLAKLLDSSFVDAINFIFNLNNNSEHTYLYDLIKEGIF